MANGIKMLELEIETLQQGIKENTEKLMFKMQRLAEYKAKLKINWMPEYNEDYYYINSIGEIELATNTRGFDNHIKRIKIGNCFKTEEQAKRRQFEIEFYNDLLRFAIENDDEEINWGDATQSKYHITYGWGAKKLVLAGVAVAQYPNVVFFHSKTVAQRAMEHFKDEFNRYFLEED